MPPKGSKSKRAPLLDNDSGDELEGVIRKVFADGCNDIEATAFCQDSYDADKYFLSVKSYRKLWEQLDLFSVRKQHWTLEEIHPLLVAARSHHPNAGIQEMINILRSESQGGQVRVSRSLVHEWMHLNEPEQLQVRKRRMAKRRQYYSSGANEVWAMDQHDKWKRFGLWLHAGLDVFSGRVLWMKVYWTNSNPRLICKYYLDAIQDPEVGGMPLLTYSDPGSENYGIANAQSTLRQMLDPSLRGTMQHKWLRKHGNIKPEILWSQLRSRAAPALEALMQLGIDQGWYDSNSNIEMLIFRWIWMPIIQSELDRFVYRYNTYRKRSNTKTLLPHGRPKYIFKYPNHFGGEDYKVTVPLGMLNDVRSRYADPNHPVFTWIPPLFEQQAQRFYQDLGGAAINRDNAWDCYHQILDRFRRLAVVNEMHQQLSLEGDMQDDLLIQSESGSHRGDVWGYDIGEEEGGNQLVGDVDFLEEDNFPEGEFSGGEDNDEIDIWD